MNQCFICGTTSSTIHMHHSIPRSRGGDNSKQVPLCGECHSTLHNSALGVVSRIRNPKSKSLKSYWSRPELEEQASGLLQVLVKALLQPPVGDRQHMLSFSVSTQLYEEFKLLQLELGLSSQEKALAYCINSVLHSRGLKNVLSKDRKSESNVWFLPVFAD